MGSLIGDWLSLKADQAAGSRAVLENEVVQSLLRQRARSPGTAVSARDSRSAPGFQELVDSGIVREAAPGTFYVYQRALEHRPSVRKQPLTPRKLLMTIVFWLLMILIPVALIQFSQ